jgi:hypothetical protein
MADRLERLESRVDELVAALESLERRLGRIEASAAPREPAPVPSSAVASEVPGFPGVDKPGLDTTSVAGVLGVLGRAFLVLCGAFLLRSLTDAGFVPQTIGVALGYLYAALWVVLADRAAAAGRALAATLSGSVAAIIAYPLLWETTSRFELLTPDQAIAGLALFTALALAIAWRRQLRSLAALVLLAGLVTDLILMLTHRSWGSGSVVALALAAVSVWGGYLRGWQAVRWPVAVLVDVLPLMLISNAIRGMEPGIPPGPTPTALVLVGCGFITVYLGSFTLAMLGMRRRVGVFEIAQGAAVLLAGFGALHHCLATLGIDDRWFGILTLIAGLICYSAAFAFIDRRFGRGGNFIYFSSLALILTIGGLAIATHASLGIAVLCGFGVAAAILGARFDRITLRAHSAVYIAVAAVLGGTLGRVLGAFILAPERVARLPELTDVIVISAAAACYLAIAIAGGSRAGRWLVRVPDFLLVAIALVGIGGMTLMLFAEAVGRNVPVDPAVLAAARSATLAVAAIGAAALGSLRDDRALRWLVYPLLVLCGLKLLVEDLPNGRPATLFVAFACFGVSLIVAPRLLRSAQQPADSPPEP